MKLKDITTKGLIRLGIFLVASLVGLAGVAANFLGYGDAAGLLGGISAGLLPIVGGTASYNIEKAPDQAFPVNVEKVLPGISTISGAVREYGSDDEQEAPEQKPAPKEEKQKGNALLTDLRKRVSQNVK